MNLQNLRTKITISAQISYLSESPIISGVEAADQVDKVIDSIQTDHHMLICERAIYTKLERYEKAPETFTNKADEALSEEFDGRGAS